MKTVWTIIKKEFSRFFKDRRLVISLLLPGILIYAVYSFLGSALFSKIGGGEQGQYHVCVVRAPESMEGVFAALEETGKIVVERTDEGEKESYIEKIRDKSETVDLLVEFPEQFDEGLSSAKQTVVFTYHSANEKGVAAAELMKGILDEAFSPVAVALEDTSSEKDTTGMIFSMLAPMLLLTFLFSGCLSIAPESIAGEKERGTLCAMLVTPAPRGKIAIGKITALSVIALCSGLCSFCGVVLSLPKLMSASGLALSATDYAFSDYALMLVVVLSTVLLMVAAVSLLSALAKSVKEATSWVGPLSLLPMIVGFSTMFTSGQGSVGLYFIPLYNSARALYSIFSFAASPLRVAVTAASNLLWAAALSVLLAKAFNNEKIISRS